MKSHKNAISNNLKIEPSQMPPADDCIETRVPWCNGAFRTFKGGKLRMHANG